MYYVATVIINDFMIISNKKRSKTTKKKKKMDLESEDRIINILFKINDWKEEFSATMTN